MDDINKTGLKKASEHGIQAPLALLAELSHRCPLQCPYCSNPVQLEKKNRRISYQPVWLPLCTSQVLIIGL